METQGGIIKEINSIDREIKPCPSLLTNRNVNFRLPDFLERQQECQGIFSTAWKRIFQRQDIFFFLL